MLSCRYGPGWKSTPPKTKGEIPMITLATATRLTFILGGLLVCALVLSNFALLDIQHGNGQRLEWTIMHISYAVFILFNLAALVTLSRWRRNREADAAPPKSTPQPAK